MAGVGSFLEAPRGILFHALLLAPAGMAVLGAPWLLDVSLGSLLPLSRDVLLHLCLSAYNDTRAHPAPVWSHFNYR